jgi:hypothetical protein
LQSEPKESGIEGNHFEQIKKINILDENLKKDFGKKVVQSTFKSTHLDDIDTEDIHVSR